MPISDGTSRFEVEDGIEFEQGLTFKVPILRGIGKVLYFQLWVASKLYPLVYYVQKYVVIKCKKYTAKSLSCSMHVAGRKRSPVSQQDI